MKSLFTTLIVTLYCLISFGQQAMISSPVTVEWGRGHRCTGRAICSVAESSTSQYSNATLVANTYDDSYHLQIHSENLTKTEIAFLFTPMTIEIDKVSKVDVGGQIVSILPGRYGVELSDGNYIVQLTHSADGADD